MSLCNLEISKALNALGYDGERYAWIDRDDGTIERDKNYLYDYHIPCPRIDDAVRFLRNMFGIHIYATFIPSCRTWIAHLEDMFGYYDITRWWPSGNLDYDSAIQEAVSGVINIVSKRHKHK